MQHQQTHTHFIVRLIILPRIRVGHLPNIVRISGSARQPNIFAFLRVNRVYFIYDRTLLVSKHSTSERYFGSCRPNCSCVRDVVFAVVFSSPNIHSNWNVMFCMRWKYYLKKKTYSFRRFFVVLAVCMICGCLSSAAPARWRDWLTFCTNPCRFHLIRTFDQSDKRKEHEEYSNTSTTRSNPFRLDLVECAGAMQIAMSDLAKIMAEPKNLHSPNTLQPANK